MDEKIEILLRFYEIQMGRGKHTEDQRASATNLTMLIAFGIITFFQTQTDITVQIVLAATIIFLGLYGALISYKLYERYMHHTQEAITFVHEIDSLVKGLDIMSIVEKSEGIHAKEFSPKWLIKFRLYSAWIGINILIAVVGIFLLIYRLI